MVYIAGKKRLKQTQVDKSKVSKQRLVTQQTTAAFGSQEVDFSDAKTQWHGVWTPPYVSTITESHISC